MYGKLGMSNTMALTLTAIWGTIATGSAVLTTFYFDKLGRKPVIVSVIDPHHLKLDTNHSTVHLLRIPNYGMPTRCYTVGTIRSWWFEQPVSG